MVACFIALIVFSIMGIFSAKYRQLAKEAFRCVFLKITFRPCDVGLDKKIKAGIVVPLSKKSPDIANFLNKYFELLSFIFTIIMIVSFILAIQGIYNWVTYGNCEGPLSGGACIYNQILGSNENPICPNTEEGIVFGPTNARIQLIEFGCYSCPYTKKAEPTVQMILEKYPNDVRYIYKVLPIPTHNNSKLAAQASICAYDLNFEKKFKYLKSDQISNDKGKYWEYRGLLFENQDEIKQNSEKILEYAEQIGFDKNEFQVCMNSEKTQTQVAITEQEGAESKIKGTPTFFVNHVYVQTENLEGAIEWEMNLPYIVLGFVVLIIIIIGYFFLKR